ncbi:pre-mRNA-splicing factor ATP-dependent RNA helicase PRP43 [Akanthomyces lecanii RCEF 1005]|uniref:Pre-mRNA-splicing factor ATP-dependent RNA helicase PRP43 n=1 Tax=Akanthomyces lecanii RCEF 1005 TaxID=1081108 RepID=A0A168DTJ0_CORDF|nr:pre-mRNA-splicing factor ATP-dependent RNA helicase PRP43 [Akanthomyces lecanii RCEF 1005]
MLDIAVLCSARRSILAGPLDIKARNCAIASYGYAVVDSDHVLLMHLLRMYTLVRDSFLREGKLEELGAWCRRCGLDRAASEVAAQEVTRLTSWLVKHPGMALQYTPQNSSKPILLALVKVFYTHLAIGCPQAYYGRDFRWETVPNREIARIAPASAVYRLAPQWVLYNSIKHCLGWSEMHIVSTVYPEWLLDLPFFRGLDVLGATPTMSRGGFAHRHVRDSLAAAAHRQWLAAERQRLMEEERRRDRRRLAEQERATASYQARLMAIDRHWARFRPSF